MAGRRPGWVVLVLLVPLAVAAANEVRADVAAELILCDVCSSLVSAVHADVGTWRPLQRHEMAIRAAVEAACAQDEVVQKIAGSRVLVRDSRGAFSLSAEADTDLERESASVRDLAIADACSRSVSSAGAEIASAVRVAVDEAAVDVGSACALPCRRARAARKKLKRHWAGRSKRRSRSLHHSSAHDGL